MHFYISFISPINLLLPNLIFQFSLYCSSCHFFFNFFFRFRISKWNVDFTLGRLNALESHAVSPAFAFVVCFVGGEMEESKEREEVERAGEINQ